MDPGHPAQQIGDYRLLREVGRGAMGIVYEAITPQARAGLPAGSRVALKLLVFPPLLPEAERAGLILRFAREAQALAAIRHPNVVRVYDVGEADGQPFMAMEFLTGQNARERLAQEGPLPLATVCDIGRQLCAALEAAHAVGIIHRDVKPENIVLEPDGSLRLTDFGIARVEVEASLTRTGGLLGSPAYMSPEQILGGDTDGRSDLFSAGVTLYQLLTGELPFQGVHLMEVAHRVAYDPPRPLTGAPPAVAAVLLRALAKAPADRYPDAAAMADALHAAASAPQASSAALAAPPAPATTIRPPNPQPPTSISRLRPSGRPAWLVRIEVVAIALLFALLMWSLYPLRR